MKRTALPLVVALLAAGFLGAQTGDEADVRVHRSGNPPSP